MTTYLLDVNVMIALIDPAHVHHETAHVWFKARGRRGWASCPLIENGVIRIVTDTYLLALACAHDGQLATFDNRLVVDAVRNGRAALHLIQ